MTTDEEETLVPPAVAAKPTEELTPAAAAALCRISTKIEDQPPPQHSDRPAVWDLVIADMRDRDTIGRGRYGTPLQTHNGRDALVDAYQETLDQVVYLRQEIEERADFRAELAAAREEARRARAVLLSEAEADHLREVLAVAEIEWPCRREADLNAEETLAVIDRVTAPALGTWQPSERDLLKDARLIVRERIRNDEVRISQFRGARTDQAVIDIWQRHVDNGKAIEALLTRMLDG